MLIIGLTGGISSGKTTVAKQFSALGVPVIDTDEISRNLTQKGAPILAAIQEQFGNDIIDINGELDRRALARRVFDNSDDRKKLESILHPAIWHEVEAQIKHLNAEYCLLVIPLLLETGNQKRVDRILVVDTSEELQVRRTQQRDQRSKAEIEAILTSQVSRQQRLSQADDVITNTSDPDLSLEAQVLALHQQYLDIARQQ